MTSTGLGSLHQSLLNGSLHLPSTYCLLSLLSACEVGTIACPLLPVKNLWLSDGDNLAETTTRVYVTQFEPCMDKRLDCGNTQDGKR